VRLVVGYGLISHGVAKLNRGPEAFADTLAALAVPNPHVMAWCTIVIELLGGLGILLGAFVSLLSLPVAAILLVAILKVHLQYGFSSIKLQAITATGAKFGAPGYETALLYLAGLATLVIGGAGPLAIDGWLRKGAQGGAHSCKP
jgi:putative oxidoreductase